MAGDEKQDCSPGASPEEVTDSETVMFDNDGYVMQGGKIALTAEGNGCGHKFARIR